MDDHAIREKLREAFRTFALPRTMPTPLHGSTLQGYEAITINGGRGRLCSVCGEIIPSRRLVRVQVPRWARVHVR